MNGNDAPWNDGFSIRFYTYALKEMLLRPAAFFRQIPENEGLGRPAGFLLTSALFVAAANATQLSAAGMAMAVVLSLNAAAMPFLLTLVGWPVTAAFSGGFLSYFRIFPVFAYPCGLFALVGWIPAFSFFAEITKWFFVGIGLVHTLGLKRWKAALITVITMGASFILLRMIAVVLA